MQLFADSAFGHLGSFFSDLSVRLCQHDHAEEMDAPALAFLGAIFGAFSFPCHARCDGGLFFWLVNVRKRRTVLLFEFKDSKTAKLKFYTPPGAGWATLRLRGGLTGVARAPLQSHDLVLNVRIAIFEYICLLKSGDFGIFRKLENFEWEEIKNFHS